MKQTITPFPFSAENKPDLILKYVSLALVIVAAVFLSFRQIYGEDIGFHLKAGKWMIENLSFPDKDTFTYTANQNKYIDLHWLYQLMMYAVCSAGGSAGLVFANSFFIVAALLILFRRCWGSLFRMLPWVFLAGILAVSPTFEIRPHSLSWLLLIANLYILDQFYHGNAKILRWLPALMILWVNCHSLFVLGIVSMGCYGISILFTKRELFRDYLIWCALATAACLINPYSWHAFELPVQQLIELNRGSVFQTNIREFQNPFSITEYELSFSNIISKWHFFDLFILMVALGIIIRFRKLLVHEWLITLVFFYFACSASKNIGYFVFAVIPIIAGASGSNPIGKFLPGKFLRLLSAIFPLVCLILILAVRTNLFYIHYHSSQRFGYEWRNGNLPVKAVDFLNSNHLHGKMLNQLDLGGYIEFFTELKTSIDGRLEVMRKEIFTEQVLANSAESKKKLLEKHKPDIIIFSYYITPEWLVFLKSDPDWRLVYVDGYTAVYLRNSYAPELRAVDEKIFTAGITGYSDEQIDAMVKNKREDSFIASLFSTQYYPEAELHEMLFCAYYGWLAAAKQVTAEGLRRSTRLYPDLYQNFGTIYFEYKDKERALYSYQKFLETTPSKPIEERVRFLKNL